MVPILWRLIKSNLRAHSQRAAETEFKRISQELKIPALPHQTGLSFFTYQTTDLQNGFSAVLDLRQSTLCALAIF